MYLFDFPIAQGVFLHLPLLSDLFPLCIFSLYILHLFDGSNCRERIEEPCTVMSNPGAVREIEVSFETSMILMSKMMIKSILANGFNGNDEDYD